MTASQEQTAKQKLIHVAKIWTDRGWQWLFLRASGEEHYIWFLETSDGEKPTPIEGATVEEAIRLARRHWFHQSFAPLGCGFRFSLPERDEHGINALFHQMAASYATPNGVYFDAELGHNCVVHAASNEARDLYRQLQASGRL